MQEVKMLNVKPSIAVIGQGFVGGSLATVFAERGFDVYVYDIAGKSAPGTAEMKFNSIHELVTTCTGIPGFSGVYFLCVPTPMNADGSADLSIVQSALYEVVASNKHRADICKTVVIKSTIPPGTTEKFNCDLEVTNTKVVFSPEFLTEANALDDMREQSRIILGGPRPYINTVKQVFLKAFPTRPIIKTNSTTAEMVKYFTNVQLAARVVLSCELAEICELLDKRGYNIDYDKVLEYAKYDERLGNSHMNVPGNDGIPGARGHCVIAGTVVKMRNDINGKSVENLKTLDEIDSCDALLTQNESKYVKSTSMRKYSGVVYTFVVGDKRVTCTPEHILPVYRDGKIVLSRAEDITTSDELFVAE